MQVIRGVFDVPKDCSDFVLKQEFRTQGYKFLEHFEALGWVLRSPLDFYLDAGRSAKDPLKNHYVIRGMFYPLNVKEDKPEEIHLPDKVVQKLLKKMPHKVKILE